MKPQILHEPPNKDQPLQVHHYYLDTNGNKI